MNSICSYLDKLGALLHGEPDGTIGWNKGDGTIDEAFLESSSCGIFRMLCGGEGDHCCCLLLLVTVASSYD